jgi:adenine-specific DNA methylase
MSETFTDIFFDERDASFLDSFRSHVNELNVYKRALALSIMNRAMTRKVPLGHFAHTMTFKYKNDKKRIKRNKSLIIPVQDIFLSLVPLYNNAVFSNHKHNIALNYNVFDLNEKADCIYFDPPYCGSHPDYQSFYHVLETFSKYWNKEFINSTNMYYPKRTSHFTKKSEVIQSFKDLFKKFQNTKYWLLSYNNKSYPDIVTLSKIISKYKEPHIIKKEYKNSVGGKGSVKGSCEVLILCK